MTAPLPPPGWYPDPDGANTWRYFDGTKWTDHFAPLNPPSGPGPLPPSPPQSERPASAKYPWLFVMLAIAGTFVTFVLMQLAFGAGAGAESGSVWFEIVGFVLLVIWLASVVATIVGLIGAVVWGVRQLRSR